MVTKIHTEEYFLKRNITRENQNAMCSKFNEFPKNHMAHTPPTPPQSLLSDLYDDTSTDLDTPELILINSTNFQERISIAPVEHDLETNNVNACKYMTAEDFN